MTELPDGWIQCTHQVFRHKTSFRDLFVSNCLSHNPKWTLPDMTKWCIYSKSSILMLQNDTIANYFRLELVEIWTWIQCNYVRLTQCGRQYRELASIFVVKSNCPVCFFQQLIWNVKTHCFMHDFWWYIMVCHLYVGAFYKGAKHLTVGGPGHTPSN
jgi:hypothetical protein